ncbi:MAG: hypothetical protein AB1489_24220 [Acidobacteriota bacterium]
MVNLLVDSEMVISGVDTNGEPRVVELTQHPFFIGTVFQPERSALAGTSHPLITEYVKAISKQSKLA